MELSRKEIAAITFANSVPAIAIEALVKDVCSSLCLNTVSIKFLLLLTAATAANIGQTAVTMETRQKPSCLLVS